MVFVDHNTARTLKSCETWEQTKGEPVSATKAVVACGCDMAGVISAVLGVFVGGRYSTVLETLMSEEGI